MQRISLSNLSQSDDLELKSTEMNKLCLLYTSDAADE